MLNKATSGRYCNSILLYESAAKLKGKLKRKPIQNVSLNDIVAWRYLLRLMRFVLNNMKTAQPSIWFIYKITSDLFRVYFLLQKTKIAPIMYRYVLALIQWHKKDGETIWAGITGQLIT